MTKTLSICAVLLLAGCQRDMTTAEWCGTYQRYALSIERCLETDRCVVSSDELRNLSAAKKNHPQCFKQDIER